MTITIQSEYRNLPLDCLTESSINPRRSLDEAALTELANSIRSQGVLSPLLVRYKGPILRDGRRRRYRAARLAGQESVLLGADDPHLSRVYACLSWFRRT